MKGSRTLNILQLNVGNVGTKINLSAVQQDDLKIRAGLIAPAKEATDSVLAPEHTSDPIKSMDDIMRVSKYLLDNGRYRDNMLFIVGINFGLRVSDLRMLRFSNLINDNMTFKSSFPIFEQKTRNTRKHKRNRYITINAAVRQSIITFLEHTPNVCLSDYMFRSESNRGGLQNQPIHRNSVDRILKGIAKALDLNIQMSTHTLRKTFAYHQMVMSNNDPRKLLLLQKMMGHSTAAQTLDYIGITGEEIEEAYRKLNLGSATCNYLIDSDMVEVEDTVG
nr:MAG TPA: site specific tyrosine recombinase [Bacteriophage sp.]